MRPLLGALEHHAAFRPGTKFGSPRDSTIEPLADDDAPDVSILDAASVTCEMPGVHLTAFPIDYMLLDSTLT